jgi:hypothetical protein
MRPQMDPSLLELTRALPLDSDTSVQTPKSILGLGYRIVPPPREVQAEQGTEGTEITEKSFRTPCSPCWIMWAKKGRTSEGR